MSSASLPAGSVSKDDLPERRKYVRTVVVGVDGSQIAEYSFDYYIRNLHQHGNYVVLVHAFELPAFHSFQELYVTPETWHATLKKEADKTIEMRRHLRTKMSYEKIPGKFVAKGGKPGEVIVKVAEDEDADLIVVGTRGHGKLRRAIMGSVSSYVSHHAPCPVTICRPKGYHQHTQKEGGTGRTMRRRCQSESDATTHLSKEKEVSKLVAESKKISIVEDTHPQLEGILHTDKKPISRQSSASSHCSSNHDSHVHFADEVESEDDEHVSLSKCSSQSSNHHDSHVHFGLDSDTEPDFSPTEEKKAHPKSDSHVHFATEELVIVLDDEKECIDKESSGKESAENENSKDSAENETGKDSAENKTGNKSGENETGKESAENETGNESGENEMRKESGENETDKEREVKESSEKDKHPYVSFRCESIDDELFD